MVEHSAAFLRFQDVAGMEIRATVRYSAEEVRGILSEHPGVPAAIDLRLKGCPDFIFDRMLERRKRQIERGQLREHAREIGKRIAAEGK